MFDGLTRFSPTAQVEPALAERWDITSDGRTYTFHLRHNVRFHDGTTFTALDVVASWERALDPSTKSSASEFLYPIKGARDFHTQKAKSIAGLSIRDDSTIVITLEEPLAAFVKLAMPVASVVPRAISPEFGEHPIGTGPWRFVEWRHDDFLLFARNDQYFLGAPKAESLEARIIAEPSTSVAEFESGTVDVLQIPAGQTREWEDDESRRPMLSSTPALELVYVGINTTRGPLTNVGVRQAINYAVDINTIVERLISGRGTRAAGVVPRRSRATTPLVSRTLTIPRRQSSCSRLPVTKWHRHRVVDVRDAHLRPHSRDDSGILNAVGIRTKVVQRESAARAAARKGETDMILKDWYAGYPDAENFLYLCSTVATRARAATCPSIQARFDSTVIAARLSW